MTDKELQKAAKAFVAKKPGYNTPTGRQIFLAGAEVMRDEVVRLRHLLRKAVPMVQAYGWIDGDLGGEQTNLWLHEAKQLEVK